MTDNLPSTHVVPFENEIKTLSFIAKTAQNSGLYAGVGGESKILMILLAAHELGIKPMVALNGGIWNIQGKIEISARLMNSMIRRAGHSIVLKRCDKEACIIEGKRADTGDTFSSQFTIEDANKAGISGRTTWKTYTEDMLYSRAMSRLARRLFPDIIGTAYVEGEIRDGDIKFDKPLTEEIEQPSTIEIPVEEVEEDCSETINSFCAQYPELSDTRIREFLDKMKNHRKTSMSNILEEFRNHDHFIDLFGRFQKSIKAA